MDVKTIKFIFLILLAIFVCNDMPAQSRTEKTLLLQGYKKYQTFNEFKMRGEGVAVDTPFVYVKKEGQKITTRISNNIDSAIVYEKEGKYWKNIISCAFENFGHPDLNCLCIDGPENPHEYIRYISNDTIMCLYYFLESPQKDIEHKILSIELITPGKIVEIFRDEDQKFIPYKDDLNIILSEIKSVQNRYDLSKATYIDDKEKMISVYQISLYPDKMIMINPKGDKITYRYKSLKLYGITPDYVSNIKNLIRKYYSD